MTPALTLNGIFGDDSRCTLTAHRKKKPDRCSFSHHVDPFSGLKSSMNARVTRSCGEVTLANRCVRRSRKLTDECHPRPLHYIRFFRRRNSGMLMSTGCPVVNDAGRGTPVPATSLTTKGPTVKSLHGRPKSNRAPSVAPNQRYERNMTLGSRFADILCQ